MTEADCKLAKGSNASGTGHSGVGTADQDVRREKEEQATAAKAECQYCKTPLSASSKSKHEGSCAARKKKK